MTGGSRPDGSLTRVEVPGGQGVQVGDHNVQENTFIGQYVETQFVQTQRAPVVWPVRVGDVPQQPPAFQPRQALLAALARRGQGMPVVRAVIGMRGVGKTQVAAAYARSRMADGWRLVAWVSAADIAKVLNGLGEVAARLGVTGPDGDLESAAARVRSWLEADGGQCLLVFDNAADLNGLRPFVPAVGDAQVVITSSLQAAADLGQAITVDVFTEDEALAFLAERTRSADTSGARELAAELGYLPLALAQAAAVIARQRLGYGTYLDRLRTLPVGDYLAQVEADTYPHGVAAAVLLSMDSAGARDSSGLRGSVMDLVAVLSTAGVNRALLYAAGQDGALGREMDAADVPVAVDAGLERLADVSLLTFSMDGSSVSAHRLVTRVVRELRAGEGTLVAAGAAAARLLQAASDSLGPTWQKLDAARDLIQQIMALHEHLAPHLTAPDTGLTRELLRLRGWAVRCLNELGDSPTQTIEYGQSLAADCEQVLGSDHPDTLTSRNDLAAAYRSAGWFSEAIPLFERTLADRERVLGPDHPDTLTSRNDLAAAYQSTGWLSEAIPLFERTLADRERVLGPDHPDTLTSRNNLAYAYLAAGQPGEAIPLYERTLADRERVLGPDTPDTLISRNNLALAYQSAGRLSEAIPLFERTLAEQERALGPDRPATLATRNNLAYCCAAAGRLSEAIPLYERSLADRERVLGPDHPGTLRTRDGLAVAYQKAGRLSEAIPLLERNLADYVRVIGPDHPHPLISRNNLAGAYLAAGRHSEAIALFESTLASRERALGPDHPDTLTTQNDLAGAYLAAAQPGKAIRLYERTLIGYERTFGGDHPFTEAARDNLASAQRSVT